MGIIDWIILIILLLFAVQGLRKGLVAGLIKIGGMIAFFFLIGHFYPLVRNSLLASYHLNRTVATAIAWILILVLLVVVVRLVIWLLDKLLKSVMHSPINKFFGLLLGFLNGLLLIIVFTILVDYVPVLAKPLKNPANHRVYAAVDMLKVDLVSTLKMKQYDKYLHVLDKLRLDKEKAAAEAE